MTDLHVPMLIMTVLTLIDVSKFFSVNTAVVMHWKSFKASWHRNNDALSREPDL